MITMLLLRLLLVTLVSRLKFWFSSFLLQSSLFHFSWMFLTFYYICDLHRICPVLDITIAHTMRTSFVHSRLDYCYSMYYCLPHMQLDLFKHTQNAVAVFAAPKSSNPDILKTLHWLKVVQNALNTKLFAPHSFSLLLHITCMILSQSSLLDPLDYQHWSLFSNHQLTPVPRSKTALSSMPHLTCETNFLLLFMCLISPTSIHHHHPALLHR